MSFRCGCLVILSESDPGVRFVGGGETLPQPKGARLFPLSRVRKHTARWVELSCTREDEHPLNGQHWHETPGGFRTTWDVPEDTIWMAGPAERTGAEP